MKLPTELTAGTVAELIPQVAATLDAADLVYGHGTDNAMDEAAALVFFVLGLDHSQPREAYATTVTAAARERVSGLLAERVAGRLPLPYITGEAWFAGLPFAVDARVLVPRSPIAELILEQFEPWVQPDRVRRIVDVGTGSGCIAIGCALAFPDAEVWATDVSPAALQVAAINATRHGVADRLRLVETDHCAGLQGPFDLMVSNPPYVPAAEMADLPAEYRHEPVLGLVSGTDGLDSARRILQDAAALLAPHGTLVLEVGAQWEALQQAYPHIAFTWLEFAHGGTGVAVVDRASLAAI
ncbi:MAG: 50S ribosomal protein L3 N(5)-glutamine methyltransferase [Gammaproteobacteria bacterium]|jgi:ribosomal protein L3 glutamine methyltransferase|nr:50S ribosomal protein L3 N(5)-glutamine methyltransferase [Gammaproteobacteria bacterium]